MGSVYRATDTVMQREVAIKERTPDPSVTAQGLAAVRVQFQREAQILGALSHPNLPHIYDFFTADGNEYVVMEFIEGQNLEQAVQQYGAINEGAVRAWAEQILNALVYIHQRHIIHRDIKPSNIIIKSDGKAVLVDFGLVKLLDPNDPRTATVLRGMGTAEYAPLEQFSPGMHTDARSDIYSFGATLYHLLSGRPPLDVPRRLLDPEQQPTLRALNPEISTFMEAVVQKALEIQPGNRYQTAVEMRDALLQPAIPPPPEKRARRLIAVSVALLVCITLVAASWFLFRDANGNSPTTVMELSKPSSTRFSSPAITAIAIRNTEHVQIAIVDLTSTASSTNAVPATVSAVPSLTPTASRVATATDTALPIIAGIPTTSPTRTRIALATKTPPSDFVYPAPTLTGTCGSTLAPGDFILDISFPPGLKADEAFDIRARPSWELNKPGWRGVAVTRETHYFIPGRGKRLDYSFINNRWERGSFNMTVAVIRVQDGNKMIAQLSPESNVCDLEW